MMIDRLGMSASADTMLRIVRAETASSDPAPSVLGVNDWVWRKGFHGTMLVDLDASTIVDLLSDRESVTSVANRFMKPLRDHIS
jgi:hypothetical protein